MMIMLNLFHISYKRSFNTTLHIDTYITMCIQQEFLSVSKRTILSHFSPLFLSGRHETPPWASFQKSHIVSDSLSISWEKPCRNQHQQHCLHRDVLVFHTVYRCNNITCISYCSFIYFVCYIINGFKRPHQSAHTPQLHRFPWENYCTSFRVMVSVLTDISFFMYS